jgi:peptidoglycan/xylan/chitin deacetylase (PgdA/CDA1 family)
VDRRNFVMMLAAGTAAVLSGCTSPLAQPGPAGQTSGAGKGPIPTDTHSDSPISVYTDASGHRLSLIQTAKPDLPVVPGGPPSHITHLDCAGKNVALTIDDGDSPEVVSAYIDFARATGVRLTFFVSGSYPSWTEHRDRLRPFVDSGQIQLANHTWTHADLTRCSDRRVESELTRCEKFLNNTFGVTGKPFVRPPYGYRNRRVDAVAASLGYTSMTTWYGTFGDSGLITEAVLLDLARRWIRPQAVLIGHANHPTVTHLYGPIIDIIRDRHLQTVTLDDAWYGAKGRNRVVQPSERTA